MTEATATISVNSVRKSFGAIPAVDGVSFEIAPGEAFGLLGPNGAGKTTTLSMLVGIIAPDAGDVRINGGDPANKATRQGIGIAPQSLSLYEELTAAENLSFFAKLYDYSGKRLAERIEWALEFAALTDRSQHLVKTYSGGMKRRLNMAVALIHDPQVILFDEPTVGVDPQSRNHIFDRIEQLKDGGRTIIYTTHYMEEAQRLCDRVGIMDQGKLLAVDTVNSLLKAHGGDSTVEGQLNPECQSADFPGLKADGSFRFESGDPLQQVTTLTAAGVSFQTLQIRQPDLETVFLSLTGRRLRDE